MLILATDKDNLRRHWRQAIPTGDASVEVTEWRSLVAELTGRDGGIVLLHLALPGLEGGKGIRELREAHPGVRVMVLCDRPDTAEGMVLLRQGVHAYLNSFANPALLATAIGVVKMGEVWVGRQLMSELILGSAENPAEPARGGSHVLDLLSAREREIATLVARGASNKIIAREMGITERTVKAHLTSIFAKTGARDRLQLALKVNEPVPSSPLPQAGLL